MNPIIPLEHLILIGVLILTCVAIVSWRTAHQVSFGLRVAMTVARVLAVGGVLVLLLNIGSKKERFQEGNASWALVVDKSSSMTFDDTSQGSRWAAAKDIIEKAFSISENNNMVHLYTFADTVEPILLDDIDSIKPDGNDTRIIEAGRQVMTYEKSRGTLLRGMILLSDGRQPLEQAPEEFSLRAAAAGVPVFPIVLGDKVPSKDVEINIPRMRHVSFIGQPVSITGTLKNHRMGSMQTEVVLRDAEQNIIEKKSLLIEDLQEVNFQFEINKSKPGYYEYLVETPIKKGESNRANNSIALGVFVLEERLSVLMLEGEPYWDTKFLSHLLRAQTNISMNAVFRVTKDRFFKVSSDTAMTATDTDAFPQTIDELAKFDLVVMGKGIEYFIDTNRAKLLEKYVKDYGGCLFFARGKGYVGTDSYLGELEPVKWGKPIKTGFNMQPLLAGEQVGLFGGLLPARKDSLWHELPHLSQANKCLELRSFSTVLAEGVPKLSGTPSFPLLVSKRFGKGIILLINGDGLWKWGFSPDIEDNDGLYQNLWIRLFQWAVSYAEFNPGSDYFIQTNKSTSLLGEPFRVYVGARVHADIEKPIVRIYRDNILVQTIALAENASSSIGWNGLVILNEKGIYRIVAETADGNTLNAHTTIQVLSPPGETDNFSADRDFLKILAEGSSGRIIKPEELNEVIANLEKPKKHLRKGDVKWQTEWDKAWVILLLMILFSMEWYWRRQQGLR